MVRQVGQGSRGTKTALMNVDGGALLVAVGELTAEVRNLRGDLQSLKTDTEKDIKDASDTAAKFCDKCPKAARLFTHIAIQWAAIIGLGGLLVYGIQKILDAIATKVSAAGMPPTTF